MNDNEVPAVVTIPTEATDPHQVQETTKCKTTYYLGSGVFLIGLYIVSHNTLLWSPIGIALCTFILAIPFLLNGIYHASIRRILFRLGLSPCGTLYRYCSGYLARLMSHTFLGLFATLVVIMEVVYTPRPHLHLWSLLALSMLLLYPVYRWIHRIVVREAPAWHAGGISMTLSSALVSIAAAILFSLLTIFWTDYPVFESVSSAIASQPRFLVNDHSVGLLFDYYSQARGAAYCVARPRAR